MRTLVASVMLISSSLFASTGTCDTSPGDNGASELACIASIQALGASTVVADIFHDSNGKTADQLPVFGKLYDPFGGCAQANSICNGDLSATQGTPAVVCQNALHDFATVASYVNALDWKYGNSIRMVNSHGTQSAPNALCPDWSQTVTDGQTDGYLPWEGMVFDLGGPSNRVVLFPLNDHGPQPCESVEYSVYLTDNPAARTVIDNPTTQGADPMKWNRAKLSRIYLEGWKKTRAGTDPGVNYTIEADSFSSVWSLPCGITFRYVGIIAGNDGKDLPACNFDSFDAELDAVAGLTESGAGVCPDSDRDGYVACGCSGAPAACDCNDADATVHPGAAETCDDPDKNCDQHLSPCANPFVCFKKECLETCGGELSSCAPGYACGTSDAGSLCLPADCTGGTCPSGSACDAATHTCRPSCASVVCALGQVCREGRCVDPCAGVVCPTPLTCQAGQCLPRCDCFSGNVGCSTAALNTCDRGSGQCVSPGCQAHVCAASEVCSAGACQDRCVSAVCPASQVCRADAGGCLDRCAGVMCGDGGVCESTTGSCVDAACRNVVCMGATACRGGSCLPVDTDAGTADAGTLSDAGHRSDGGTSGDGGAGNLHGTAKSGCGCGSLDAGFALISLGFSLALARRKRG